MLDRLVTALIADDEPLARRRLGTMLGEIPWLSVIAEAADGEEAVRAIDEHRPDLVFLDVVMPGLTGLEVLNQLEHRPAIVFTTAYDRYAVAAFEANALDYLLKPFGRRRLVATLDRIRENVEHARMRSTRATTDAAGTQATAPRVPVEWLFVRERGRVTPVNVARVIRFEGCDDYAVVHTEGRRMLAALRLSELEQLLPRGFVRVHRSHIVNLSMVESFVAQEGARFTVVMRDGTRIAVSRERARWLRERAI